MKNKKRAYRRYMEYVHFKRRARNYYDWSWSLSIDGRDLPWGEYWPKLKEGGHYSWMKDTGKPCSCSMCSYYKYERPTPEVVRNIINEQLEDYYEDLDRKFEEDTE